MERTFISWTIENWITVLLMVGLGYAVFALFSQFVLPKMPRMGSGTNGSGNVIKFPMAA